jgi:RNA polymerase sigma-70 factor, ECF subfamily
MRRGSPAVDSARYDRVHQRSGCVTRDRSAAFQINGRLCVSRSATSSVLYDVRALTDDGLMRLLADGQLHAFEEIFDRHSAVAFSLAYRICGRRSVAEDVVHDAFLSLSQNAARFDPGRGSVAMWLLSGVRDRAIDALRRVRVSDGSKPSERWIREWPAAPELTETGMAPRNKARDVNQALEVLSPEQRQVIELAYFAGLTHRQIAKLLELPAGAVKGGMRVGLQRLSAALQPARRSLVR